MSTGYDKVIIFLKKFLTQQHITTNFLDYIHNLILEDHQKLVPTSGVYTYPVLGVSTAVDTVSFLTPGETTVGDGNGPQLEADDGHGRILKLDDTKRDEIPFENLLGTKYHSGIRFNYLPEGTEINVRTGVIKHSLNREQIGERAEPLAASYYNSLLQFNVNGVCKSIPQTGRTVRVWLKTPVSQATGNVFEDAVVSPQSVTFDHDGGANYFDVPNELKLHFTGGQTLTVDKAPTSPTTTTVVSVGADESGGAGYARISTADDLSAYTVAATSFVLSGNNIITLAGTLGQGVEPSVEPSDYESFLFGVTITTEDLRTDEYYAYFGNFIGVGAGSSPTTFDWSDQVEIPLNITSSISILTEFMKYQLERNGILLRGGGQVSYDTGEMEWSSAFEIINPFRGVFSIAAGTQSSIANNDVLYTKLWTRQPVTINGTASGELWVNDTSDLNDGDSIIVGDADSNQITGLINGAPVGEKVIVWDGVNPIDLSAFTTSKGAWLQRTNLELSKAVFNQGDLRPDYLGDFDNQIMILAIAHGNILIFRDGVLRLEDGDIGQISDLPSGYNWINTTTELKASLIRPPDGGLGILAPKAYTVSAKLAFNKNYNWLGLGGENKITGNLADPIIEITFDGTTSGSYMQARLFDMILQNTGAGPVIKIDNTGATKGMEVTIDRCQLLASGTNCIEVVHGAAGQWIRLNLTDSRNRVNSGSIVFESQNNSDELTVSRVLMNSGNGITFGKTATNPTSECNLYDTRLDSITAVGVGKNKTIKLHDCFSSSLSRRVATSGHANAVIHEGGFAYEETYLAPAVAVEDTMDLPQDERDGTVDRYYQVGSGRLTLHTEGEKLEREAVEIAPSFNPDTYTTGTGVVEVPNVTELGLVRPEDRFVDVDSNEFPIIGSVSDVNGSKQFRIATGQTVNLGAGAKIMRQDFVEVGDTNDLSKTVKILRSFPEKIRFTFRLEPQGM